MSQKKIRARFIEPILLLRTSDLPEGADWEYELKLDGYRALAIETGEKIQLRSRNDNDFGFRYPSIVKALAPIADETVLDGEVVALDHSGRPSFNTLQNYGSSTAPIFYYIFDVPILGGRDLQLETLDTRRELLRTKVLSKLGEPIRYSVDLDASLPDLIRSVREQGLEGLVAKRRNSAYESGQRSGAWQKMRINRGQEFVVGGYTPSPKNFDALIFGYYEGKKLVYVARTRNGFTPRLREQLFRRFRKLEIPECPFRICQKIDLDVGDRVNRVKDGRLSLAEAVLVGQFEYVEWTPDNHLRHSRFVALRDDEPATAVRREG